MKCKTPSGDVKFKQKQEGGKKKKMKNKGKEEKKL